MQSTYILISAAEYAGVQIEIAGPKYHHLVRVRRMRPGMVLRAALPDGRLLEAEISEITPDILRARVLREEMITGLSPCRITLHQAVLKGEKMELVVQKASELGVATLAPLLTRRSIPQWSPQQAAQRVERWQRIADAAAEQCERCIPMLVEMPRPLPQALQVEEPNRFLLHERQDAVTSHRREIPAAQYRGVIRRPGRGMERGRGSAADRRRRHAHPSRRAHPARGNRQPGGRNTGAVYLGRFRSLGTSVNS